MTDGYGAIKALIARQADSRIELLVNMTASAAEAEEVHGRVDLVSRRFLHRGVASAGRIPHDPIVSRAVRRRVPFTLLSPAAPASRAVRGLASRLAGEVETGKTTLGFFTRLSTWLRGEG